MHPLLVAISLAMDCFNQKNVCIIEPVFEVQDHSILEELRRRRDLSYRNFDLLVFDRESRKLKFVEMKIIVTDNLAHSLLSHLASFLEKVADHVFKVFGLLRSAGYEVVLVRHRSLPPSLFRKLEQVLKSIEEMNANLFHIELRVQNIEKLLDNALTMLKALDVFNSRLRHHIFEDL